MSKYKTEQHFITHRGQYFQFVSYEGTPANEKKALPEVPATWCLMQAGKRWPCTPQLADQPVADLHQSLSAWLDHHVFAAAPQAAEGP